MQITVEITEEEYMQIESHTRRAIVTGLAGMNTPTIADKMLGRLCMAVGKKAREAQQNLEAQETTSDVTRIRAPKRACPRDLGIWYCCDCTKEHLEEQSYLDFPIPMQGCGGPFGGKICGETHLGYEWCKECQAVGRTKPHPHIGEFETVGKILPVLTENIIGDSNG